MKLQGISLPQVLPPALAQPLVKHGSLPAVSQTLTKVEAGNPDDLSISVAGLAKSAMRQRFHTDSSDERSPASYLASYAETYAKIRDEISSGDGDETYKTEQLRMLDEVYGQATSDEADRLVDQFDRFFNGAAQATSAYKMTTGDPAFDRAAFREHLAQLAETAKQIATAQPGGAERGLLALTGADRLETMDYRDIDALSRALKSMQPPPAPGSDPAKFGAKLAEWEKAGRAALHEAGLSDRVAETAVRTVNDTAKARLKTGAYTQAIDQYKAKIDEMMKKLAHLAYLIAVTNGKLESLKGLDPSDPRIQNLLRRERELADSQRDIGKELKDHQTSLKNLEKDPDKVEGTDVYRLAKASYDEANGPQAAK
ncbi:hypothetical protein [Cohnella sp. 56]|uniref:hypothetical protein n=1 Tax=Cohnella sp. 56 TaxID=3113722 RepID=UPI0030E83E19